MASVVLCGTASENDSRADPVECLYNPSSPSAATGGFFGSILADPHSPSASMAHEEEASSTTLTDTTIPLLQSDRDRDNDTHGSVSSVPMKKANCQRASRAARAENPSSEATMQAYNLMYMKFQAIKHAKIERAPKETQAFKSFKPASSSGGKGAAVRTSHESQGKMNHLASLKAKDVNTNNTEPAFLLGGFTAPLLWDRLAENSLRSNAVNSSVMNRKKTQGEHLEPRFTTYTTLLCLTNARCSLSGAANQVKEGIFPSHALGQKSGLASNTNSGAKSLFFCLFNLGFIAWTLSCDLRICSYSHI